MEGTINKDLNTIRHLLSYAMERGLIEDNPIEQFKNLKEDQKERPRFTDGQVQSVIDAAKPECTPLFLFIRETGCRREEALSLQYWQIQEDARLVVFSGDTKSRKYRYVPLTNAAIEASSCVASVGGLSVRLLQSQEQGPLVRLPKALGRSGRESWIAGDASEGLAPTLRHQSGRKTVRTCTTSSPS